MSGVISSPTERPTGGVADARRPLVMDALRSAGWLAAAVLASLLPAILNGYPLVNGDAGTYILSGMTLYEPLDRPIFYGLFLNASRLGRTLWTPIILQSAVALFLLVMVGQSIFGLTKRKIAIAAVTLSLVTSFSWGVSVVMPDVFTAALVLCFVALSSGWTSMSWPIRATILAIEVVSVLVHQSHVAIVPCALALFELFRLLQRRREVTVIVGAWRGTAAAFAAFLLAVGVMTAHNYLRTGVASPSKGAPTFTLAKFVGSGVAYQFLSEHCARGDEYAFCPHREAMKALTVAEFLWDDVKSPLNRVGGWPVAQESSRLLVRDIVRERLAQLLRIAILHGFAQIFTFDTFEHPAGLLPYVDCAVHENVQRFFPHELPAFLRSEQQTGRDLANQVLLGANSCHRVLVVISSVVLLVAMALARLDIRVRSALTLVVCFVVANGFVTGGLSVVAPRYGSRIIWLLPAMAGLTLVAAFRERAAGAQPSRIPCSSTAPGIGRRDGA